MLALDGTLENIYVNPFILQMKKTIQLAEPPHSKDEKLTLRKV